MSTSVVSLTDTQEECECLKKLSLGFLSGQHGTSVASCSKKNYKGSLKSQVSSTNWIKTETIIKGCPVKVDERVIRWKWCMFSL